MVRDPFAAFKVFKLVGLRSSGAGLPVVES